MIKWLTSRIGLIYVIVIIFCLTCMDLKMLQMRVKVRRLNDAIPDFSDMIKFSKDRKAMGSVDWKPYKDYFELVYKYLPSDPITMQLLGYVDYYNGHEKEAVDLFKGSTMMNGKDLFFSNYDLGVIYFKKGMWPQASKYLLKAVESNPKLAVMIMQNSTIYQQILVNPYFKYSLNDEVNDAQGRAYILLLSSLEHIRQYDLMLAVSRMGIANQDLAYKDAYYFYAGLAYYDMGQYKQSFLLFEKSLSLEKDNPEVYYYLANIYEKAGQMEQSRGLVQASYALHEKNDPRFPYENRADLVFF